MQNEWSNWSGSLRFTPSTYIYPRNEEEIIAEIRRAASENKKVRVVGAGHSSSALVETDDILLSLVHHKEVLESDLAKSLATMQAGLTIHEAGMKLQNQGLSMHNTGDVDIQSVVGALSTGTHGTGKNLQNLSSMLYGVRMINGAGDVVETDEDIDPDFMKAVRVSLGTMGVFTQVKLKLLPAYQLVRREYFMDTTSCITHWEELSEANRNCDFYWYPRNDMVKVRTMNLPGEGMQDLPFATLDICEKGSAMQILPRQRELKFDEMEYALPSQVAMECFLEIRDRVKKLHREKVAWRILFRTVKLDDYHLSPAYKRDTVTISLHHNAGLPFEEYFNDIEPIFRRYSGRPHWGKKHNLAAAELSQLYPQWETFQAYRSDMDPQDVFLTPYLRKLLII